MKATYKQSLLTAALAGAVTFATTGMPVASLISTEEGNSTLS
jgi:hypothetical protein